MLTANFGRLLGRESLSAQYVYLIRSVRPNEQQFYFASTAYYLLEPITDRENLKKFIECDNNRARPGYRSSSLRGKKTEINTRNKQMVSGMVKVRSRPHKGVSLFLSYIHNSHHRP